MKVDKIGEFGLIKKIKNQVKTNSSVIKGIGDDCAVLKFTSAKFQLYTCDMIVEGVDFTSRDDLMLVGRKALAICVSDIAACGGIPCHGLVSLGLPLKTKVEDVGRIYKGLNQICREFGVNIVGGDISKAPKLTIDVSLLGEVEKKNLVLRSGARPGDIIFVTGSFGGSIKGKHLSFIPRLKEARYLVRNFKVNSMIDASDGLRQDLGHILEDSRVGAVIYEDLIPVSPWAKSLKNAFCDGEDFELIFTVNLKDARKLKSFNRGFIPIGEIVAKKFGLTLVNKKIKQKKIKLCGYTHF
ncbi:MAG: thiamine-phosphate kinase [Candidatus Omnitrophica bacterium]|nr:thiamine-phosphate kinase [Candidatus Omnitrophota bacterium]